MNGALSVLSIVFSSVYMIPKWIASWKVHQASQICIYVLMHWTNKKEQMKRSFDTLHIQVTWDRWTKPTVFLSFKDNWSEPLLTWKSSLMNSVGSFSNLILQLLNLLRYIHSLPVVSFKISICILVGDILFIHISLFYTEYLDHELYRISGIPPSDPTKYNPLVPTIWQVAYVFLAVPPVAFLPGGCLLKGPLC